MDHEAVTTSGEGNCRPGRVAGKVALVTGGAMGIGEAAARCFAAEGARVVIADIAIEKGMRLVEEIGKSALFLHLDVTDEPHWHAVMATILAQLGRLDIVMNNAGLVSLGTVESVSDADWAKHMALHLNSIALGSRLGIQAMRQAGTTGSIINVSSTSTIKGYSPHFAYLAGKAAARGLTRSAAAHCHTQRLPIRVNAIIPGGILTPMAEAFVEMTKTMPADIQFSSSAGTNDPSSPIDMTMLGKPNDIGHLAVYLGSDESRFVNGAEFVVDNGFSHFPPNRRVA